MLDRVRYALAALLLFVGLGFMVQAVSAQEPPGADGVSAAAPREDLASPRKTVFTFIGAMRDVSERRTENPDGARARALDCLELDWLPAESRAERGWELALQLKRALDFQGKLAYADVPGEMELGGAPFWTLPTRHGDLSLRRVERGWVFEAATLSRVERIVAAFESSGAEAYSGRSVGEIVARDFPSLAGRALFLAHWQWIGLFLVGIACWLAHQVVAFVIAQVIGGVLGRRRWLLGAAEAAKHAGRPVGLFAVAVLIVFAGPWLELPVAPVDLHRWLVVMTSKLFASLGAVLVAYRLADVVAARMAEAAARTDTRLDDQLVPLARKSIKILVTVGGALFILDNLEADIWSLLTGAGIAGVAVAFAAKDTIANLFGSLTVFLDRPFQVGDWVVTSGVEGTVEEVGFRSTRVRTFYNSLVSVPNSRLVDGVVDNMGMRRYRRFKTTVGIRYDTPPQRIEAFCHGMRRIVLANPHMRHDYYEIYLNDWGASSLDILVYVFFDVPDWDAELRERQNFMLEVIRLAHELGVGFAFPTRTLELESTPERPPRTPQERSESDLAAVAESFAAGGSRARPEGTLRFSSRERGGHEEEARGAE